jgi:hypothetical protein
MSIWVPDTNKLARQEKGKDCSLYEHIGLLYFSPLCALKGLKCEVQVARREMCGGPLQCFSSTTILKTLRFLKDYVNIFM